MVGIVSNAGQIAKRYRQRRQRLDRALGRGLKKAASAIDREQVDNLSGPKAVPHRKGVKRSGVEDNAGGYPVPVRTGNLLGSHFFKVRSDNLAIVGNKAGYAIAIHKDRPFLDDAAEKVDFVDIMAIEVRKAIMAIK